MYSLKWRMIRVIFEFDEMEFFFVFSGDFKVSHPLCSCRKKLNNYEEKKTTLNETKLNNEIVPLPNCNMNTVTLLKWSIAAWTGGKLISTI